MEGRYLAPLENAEYGEFALFLQSLKKLLKKALSEIENLHLKIKVHSERQSFPCPFPLNPVKIQWLSLLRI